MLQPTLEQGGLASELAIQYERVGVVKGVNTETQPSDFLSCYIDVYMCVWDTHRNQW